MSDCVFETERKGGGERDVRNLIKDRSSVNIHACLVKVQYVLAYLPEEFRDLAPGFISKYLMAIKR